jgi:hypothetical protein
MFIHQTLKKYETIGTSYQKKISQNLAQKLEIVERQHGKEEIFLLRPFLLSSK